MVMKQNVNKDIRVDPPIESARIKLTTNNQKQQGSKMIQNISAMTILIAETTTILYQQLVN